MRSQTVIAGCSAAALLVAFAVSDVYAQRGAARGPRGGVAVRGAGGGAAFRGPRGGVAYRGGYGAYRGGYGAYRGGYGVYRGGYYGRGWGWGGVALGGLYGGYPYYGGYNVGYPNVGDYYPTFDYGNPGIAYGTPSVPYPDPTTTSYYQPSAANPNVPGPRPQNFTVTLPKDATGLPRVEITPGSTVYWTNESGTPQTVTSDQGLWNSGNIPAGYRYSATFNQPGTFAYHSNNNPNLRGVIVVR
jgi:plastocyanin